MRPLGSERSAVTFGYVIDPRAARLPWCWGGDRRGHLLEPCRAKARLKLITLFLPSLPAPSSPLPPRCPLPRLGGQAARAGEVFSSWAVPSWCGTWWQSREPFGKATQGTLGAVRREGPAASIPRPGVSGVAGKPPETPCCGWEPGAGAAGSCTVSPGPCWRERLGPLLLLGLCGRWYPWRPRGPVTARGCREHPLALALPSGESSGGRCADKDELIFLTIRLSSREGNLFGN